MKKIFLVGAIALSSLFLAGCGGGNGEDTDYLGVKSFANGAKYLRYGSGIVFDVKSANGYVDVTNPDSDGTTTEAGTARFDASLYGVTADDSGLDVFCTYAISEGNENQAVLTLDMTSVETSAFADEDVRKAFGYPSDVSTDAGWTTLTGFDTVVYTINFETKTLTMKATYTINTDTSTSTTVTNQTTGINFWVLK